jgi:hypothetical protein
MSPPSSDPLPGPVVPAPMSASKDKTWTLELASLPDGRFEVEVEEAGGLVRIQGIAVTRRGSTPTRTPATVVLRFEDAATLGPRIMGEISDSHRW